MLLAAVAAFSPAPCDLPGMPDDYGRLHAIDCGWVSVPRSADDPTPIRIWVAVARASEPESKDPPIVYINGGPGIATVDSVVPGIDKWKAFAPLREKRDIIFFDQRGSGRSEENFCPSLADTLNKISAAGLTPEAEADKGVAAFAECRRQAESAGVDIEAYTTMATVADIDAIRRAVGAERLKLMSVSYGSMVAMQAMRAHPKTIEAVILNSPYPPNSVAWAEQVSTAAESYAAIDRECSRQPECQSRFGALIPKLEETLSRLERKPLKEGEKVINGRQFGKALWPLAVRSTTVRFVPEAIHRAHAGDEALIRKMVAMFAGGESFGEFSPAQAYAITCHETGRTREWYTRARTLYPRLSSGDPDDSLDRLCEAYRPGHADPAFFAPVASNIPTLIYAGTFDPATPAVDAYQSMRFLSKATLVEVPGGSHAPMALDECTLGIALRFLNDPHAVADLNCLGERPPMLFPAEGLDALLQPSGS